MIHTLLLLAIAVLGSSVSVKADPFRNLSFEEADVTGLKPGDFGPISQMLPGWQVFQGTFQTPGLQYDNQFPDFGVVSLNDTPQIGLPIDGKFYLIWTDAFNENNGTLIPTSLLQRGDVPNDARTLQFMFSQGSFALQINGNGVPLIRTAFNTLAADISAFAGQNVELKFTSVLRASPTTPRWLIDDIEFSAAPIPEPSTWGIVACGVMLLFRSKSLRIGLTTQK